MGEIPHPGTPLKMQGFPDADTRPGSVHRIL